MQPTAPPLLEVVRKGLVPESAQSVPSVRTKPTSVSTTTALVDNPTTAAVLPIVGRSWTAFHNKRLYTETPHATVSFRARGKAYSVTFNSVQIQSPFLPGV